MKKKIKSTYKLFKDNLSAIILLPTLIGGIWQLLELSSISTSFIRFFSISQLVADGLLILFILSIIYLSIKLGFKFVKKKYFDIADGEKPPSIWNGIVLILCSVAMFIIAGIPILKDIYESQLVKIYELALLIPFFIIILGTILLGLFRILMNIISRNSKFFIKHFTSLKDNKKWINHLATVASFIILITAIFILRFILIDLNPYAVNFRKYVLFPTDLLNKNILDEKVKCEYELKTKPKLIYFNDRYCFYEVITKEENEKILVVNFEELLAKNTCR